MSSEKVKRVRRKKDAVPKTQAEPPNVVLDHTDLFGARHRVVVEHAPGIDYFVVVERFEKGKWKTLPGGLKHLFDPAMRSRELAIVQLSLKLAEAEATIAQLRASA